MKFPKSPIIIIPSRLAARRLPNKPLADIHGVPMIELCLRRAQEADVGPVVVACGDEEIFSVIEAAGGRAVMTDTGHPSGTDRVFEALSIVDPNCTHDCIINFQGDLPTIDPQIVCDILGPMVDGEVEISTLVAEITNISEFNNANVVKAVVGIREGDTIGRALYFSRTNVPSGEGPKYHHIGLYAYRRDALEKFIDLPTGVLEKQENLEQLRALEWGLRIDAVLVDTIPLGVDTPADLEMAREILAKRNSS